MNQTVRQGIGLWTYCRYYIILGWSMALWNLSHMALWVLIWCLFQIPVAAGVSLYEAVSLYNGKRVIASKGNEVTEWTIIRLVLYCLTGIVAGMVGGLLGLGGGFILGPLFLELGIPPQVRKLSSDRHSDIVFEHLLVAFFSIFPEMSLMST